MTERPRSAHEIAAALGLPAPTEQQRAVIEAPLASALVVAGAGSGKTETMANRVLWLLANGHVTPDQVLGLTFTRKAAGELAERIRRRIDQLAAAGLLPGEPDPFLQPTVSTYNAFANSIYRDNAALLGRDADGVVLGEAAAWQLARQTVLRSRDPRLPSLDRNLDPVAGAVLDLSRALSDNIADPEEVREFAQRFAAVAEWEPGGRGEYADVVEWAQTVGALDVLLDLAAEYAAAKRERSAVEYSDQVAFALRIAEIDPEVAVALREQHRVVLLDEYQDTSVVQTRLLARLFSGHPVMAVGDPNQSIYGWRGASASNLEQFPDRFGTEGRVYALSTSWRNGTGILAAANALVRPFAAAARVPVEPLTPAPRASTVPVATVYAEDFVAESEAVARWFAERLRPPAGAADDWTPPSAALLMRTRRTQRQFLAALRAAGVPVHVLGIGGLLSEPEIADLVCALSVLENPEAGIETVRLLTGSRWRLGVADVWALSRVAAWLRDRDDGQRAYDEAVKERMRATVTAGEGGSLVDALDFVASAPEGHSALAAFSEPGLQRLRDAGATIARLRTRTGWPLPDLAASVEQELDLDIEVAANESRPVGGAAREAFFDALDGYLALDEHASLAGFLGWLRAAEEKEDLSPRPEDPEPGTVQVLTIHGAKGLEWDLVAVPRMVTEELPARPVEGTNAWLGFGRLPWPFRGDAADLPRLEWEGAATRKQVKDAITVFKAAVGDRFRDEERRLAYVAVTRARHELLLTGSFWATQTKPRPPSEFLAELASDGLIPPLPDAPEADENPLGDRLEWMTWPLDPLGSRRAAVERAAAAVATAEPRVEGPWSGDVELLLRERAARLADAGAVPLPVRIPASRFKDFVAKPGEVAASLARPMPERPYRATRLGTLFHSWVENRYGIAGGADELDAAGGELDSEGDGLLDLGVDAAGGPAPGVGGASGPGAETGAGSDAARLAELQRTFEASPWADRRPVEVEREIHLPFDDRIVVCKIDAVYATTGEDGRTRYEIVDWKTGRAPKDAAEEEAKQLQLALYRLAYARWKGVDPADIDAVLYFVADDRIVRPDRVDDEAALLQRWRAALGREPVRG